MTDLVFLFVILVLLPLAGTALALIFKSVQKPSYPRIEPRPSRSTVKVPRSDLLGRIDPRW